MNFLAETITHDIMVEIKDIIYLVGIIASFLFQYLTMYRKHEVRIVVLETKLDSFAEVQDEIRKDVKELLNQKSTRRRSK